MFFKRKLSRGTQLPVTKHNNKFLSKTLTVYISAVTGNNSLSTNGFTESHSHYFRLLATPSAHFCLQVSELRNIDSNSPIPWCRSMRTPAQAYWCDLDLPPRFHHGPLVGDVARSSPAWLVCTGGYTHPMFRLMQYHTQLCLNQGTVQIQTPKLQANHYGPSFQTVLHLFYNPFFIHITLITCP